MRTALFAGALAGAAVAGSALAAQVDVTNSNGTIPTQLLSSNGGLGSDNFTGTSANGVSVWLRARNRAVDPGEGYRRSGSTYFIDQDTSPGTTDGSEFSFEFQFTPLNSDTVSNSNYFLQLSLDSDASMATDFTVVLGSAIFDGDSLDGNSWDDGDSLVVDGVTTRGGDTVDFASTRSGGLAPEYVVVNSWLPKWSFLLGEEPGAGYYDIRLEVFELLGDGSAGASLAATQITARVVPTPSAVAMGLAALGGLAGVSRRRL